MKKIIIVSVLLIINALQAQYSKIHVHNDYQQPIPFWTAISSHVNSLEVDVYLKNNCLYVAHEEKTITKDRTLENLYLKPIEHAVFLNCLNADKPIQLLIDIKSEPYATLQVLEKQLNTLYNNVSQDLVKVVISGNQPSVQDYSKYPSFITFDYQGETLPTDKTIQSKIALVSYDFKNFSSWNGKGKIIKQELKVLKNLIDNVHSINKPIRFWSSPDSKSSWKAFADFQVDFINTDYPWECKQYLSSLPKRWYQNSVFSKVYTPTYKTDKKNTPVKNIILMIGDGNGLSQLSSAVLANNGSLTVMQLKSSGFMKTQSADDFTTDSAASATAMATGKKTYNRAIGVDAKGQKVQSITEYLSKYNYNTACITTDDIYGATPSAFYAHQKDRGFENLISKELLTSKLTLFAGGGSKQYSDVNFKDYGFTIAPDIPSIKKSRSNKLGYFFSKGRVPSVLEGRKNALAEITKNSLEFLSKKNRPFFIMIEGAQIDTYGHHNNVAGIVSETIDFDRAITEAIKFADTNQETLVVVLADHETSGFSLPQGNVDTHHIEGAFFSHDHTGVLVPVFAYGPKSYEFEGCYENKDVFSKILKVLTLNKKE